MTLRLTPEDVVLVEAAAGRCASGAVDATTELRWEALVAAAEWHRLVPLMWEHLRDRTTQLAVPDEVLDALRPEVRASTARNLHLERELDLVLAALDAAAIPALLLKGAALVREVYTDPRQRPMGDLDILVPEEQVQVAHEVVRAIGYSVGRARMTQGDEEQLARVHHHFPLIKADGAVMVELHHRLVFDRRDFDVRGFLERGRPAAGPPAHLLPSPEDLLLHVAIHFTLDRMRRMPCALGQVGDIVRVADHWQLDWDACVARARASQVADRLFLGLEAAERLAGGVVPAAVLDALRPPTSTRARTDAFVRQRVLQTTRGLPLEELGSGALRRVLPPRASLEKYVRTTDVAVPSVARLHARRTVAITRRFVSEVPNPRRLMDDVRLSRWIVSLRR